MPSAHDLARRYHDALQALRAVHAFDTWLGAHWRDHCPAPPSTHAATTDVGGDRQITWHDGKESVFGYLPGETGCFCIAREALMPDFPLAPLPAPTVVGTDVVIRAEMQDALPSAER